MKALSYTLTCLFIFPIAYVLFYTWNYVHHDRLIPGMQPDKRIIFEMLSPVIIFLIFIITAMYLNIKGKYRENCIMCATLLISFALSMLIPSAISFLYYMANK